MESKLREGEAAFSEGKLEEAKTIFSHILESEPYNSEANNNLGVIAYKQRDLDKALLCFLRALEKDPSHEDALENLASLFDVGLSVKKSQKENDTEPSYGNYPKEPESENREKSNNSVAYEKRRLSDSLREDLGDKASEYYKKLWSDPGWCSPYPNLDEKARWEKIASFLNKILRLPLEENDPRPRLLDVGCGRGWMSPLLSRYGSYEGLDPVSPAVDISRKLFPGFRFHKGTAKTILESSDFKPYDIVINTEVVEHVPRDQKDAFAQDLRGLLKTNGHLILTTPRGEVFEHMKQHGLDEQPVEDWLTEDEIVNLFEGNGFRAIGCERIYLALSNGTFFSEPSQTQITNEKLTAIYQVWAFQATETYKQTSRADTHIPLLSRENGCVSIIIPCYNQARFLKDCLGSIIGQTYATWEAVVVDDCSTDGNPEEVVRSFNDNRVKIVRHEQNKGLAASRNTGIRSAHADLVVTIDADDMFARTYLAKTVGIFSTTPEVDCVFTDYQLFGARQARWKNQVRDAEAMTRAQWIPGAGTLMRRSLWKRVGGYCETAELRGGNEDWDFWLGAAALNIRAVHVPEALYFYRQHQISMRSNLKYCDFLTREVIYRHHSQLFDRFHAKKAFLVPGYLESACEAWKRGERLRAALLAAQGWWLTTDRSKPLPVISPSKEYEGALHQSLAAFENNAHEHALWLAFGKLAAITIANKGDLLLFFQKMIGVDESMEEIIKILAPYITFDRLGDAGSASNCRQSSEGNSGLIGETLLNEENYEGAKRNFASIIENEPCSAEAHTNLGIIAYKHGDLHTAVGCFFRALEKDPSCKDALENLAAIFNIAKDLPLLISHLEKIAAKTDYQTEDAFYVTQLLLNDVLSISAPAKESNAAIKRRPLKILYLADCRSQHTKRYVRFFKDQGHEVHIFDTNDHTEDLQDIEIHCPRPFTGKRSTNNFGDLFVHTVFELNRLIDRVRPDILHGHYLTMWGWWGAFTGFQPYVTTVWGSDIFLDTGNDFNRRFTEVCLKESCLVTADSMDLLEATARLRRKRDGLTYVPFGIDVEVFRPGYDVSMLAKRLDVVGKKIVLSPRQFKPAANIDIIIRAIPKVVARIPDAIFILKTYLTKGSCTTEYERSLRELVQEMKIQDHVIFMGDADFAEMPMLYNLSDVMVTLRDTDGSACSMLECMACKTPIVASNIESMREWIKDGENGRVVDRHSPDTVADAILEILLDQDKKTQFVNSSYALVHEKADYRKNWSEVEDLYYKLKAEGKSGRPNCWGVNNSNVSYLYDKLDTAWNLIQSHEVDQGEKVFHQILEINKLPMHIYLKTLLGLAKVEWIKHNLNTAKEHYMGCLNLIQRFELDTHLDIKS